MKQKLFSLNKKIDIGNEPRRDMILTAESDPTEIEAYKTIRTNLFFTLVHSTGCKRITVTSSISKEGKSTVCVNLAKTIAQTNATVLLIDCDLRKPRLHKFFKAKCIPGISNYLIGNNSIEEIIHKSGEQNLSIIYSGTIPPNPAEILGSAEFKNCIDELSKRYDYILMDCPPLLEVTDAMEVSKSSDGTLIVTRQNFTSHAFLYQSLKKLELAGSKILGFILNDVTKKKSKYYYRYIKKEIGKL